MIQYLLDTAHSTIEFSVPQLVISRVRGRFTNFAGLIDLDPDDITRSKVNVEIDAASLTTGLARRDAHLRSKEILDVATYPLISFESTHVEEDGEVLRVTGLLTMHGVTGEVSLRVEPLGSLTDPFGTGRIAFAATVEIDRLDFGLRFSHVFDTGGLLAGLIGERVSIELEVQAVSAAARAAA